MNVIKEFTGMEEDKKKPVVDAGKIKYYNNGHFRGRGNNPQTNISYAELKDDIFDAGNSSGRAKKSKLLKNTETYVPRT